MNLSRAEGTLPGEVEKPHRTSSAPDILKISRIADNFNNTSKVVDENGEPLVVYHGTPEGTFSVFRTDMGGAYFSADRGYAKVYARERNGHNTPKSYGV